MDFMALFFTFLFISLVNTIPEDVYTQLSLWSKGQERMFKTELYLAAILIIVVQILMLLLKISADFE